MTTKTRREELKFAGTRIVHHTARSFEDVHARLKARVGSTSVDNVVSLEGSIEDYERQVAPYVGDSGFMLFAEMDHGRWIGRYGIERRLVRWVFGNPLIAITMLKHDISAGLFVPVELLITENAEGTGCSVEYVVPSSLMAVRENAALMSAAHALDEKMEALIAQAAGGSDDDDWFDKSG